MKATLIILNVLQLVASAFIYWRLGIIKQLLAGGCL